MKCNSCESKGVSYTLDANKDGTGIPLEYCLKGHWESEEEGLSQKERLYSGEWIAAGGKIGRTTQTPVLKKIIPPIPNKINTLQPSSKKDPFLFIFYLTCMSVGYILGI